MTWPRRNDEPPTSRKASSVVIIPASVQTTLTRSHFALRTFTGHSS